jgi:hypothetical protein
MRLRTPESAAPAAPAAGRPPLEDWIDGLDGAFEAAAAARGTLERRLRLAGAPVRVVYAGTPLHERLGPALDHLRADGGEEPELTINVWASEELDGAEPPLPPATAPDAPRGTVVHAAGEGRHVAYQPGLAQLSALDEARSTAWFWCRRSDELPFWEPAAPFRQILHWWLSARGLLLVHGAAVGRRDGGLLLVGRGGSGKSTCALASLASDLLYAGDDYVAVEAEPQPRVHSLYCSGKLQPGHAQLLPHLPPPSFDGDGSPEEKAVFYVGDRFPERMSEGFPLRAVVAPRVTGSQPRVAPASPAQALAALAPSTLLQLVPAQPEAFSRMARLLEDVPAYALEVGGPVDGIPPVLAALLAEACR